MVPFELEVINQIGSNPLDGMFLSDGKEQNNNLYLVSSKKSTPGRILLLKVNIYINCNLNLHTIASMVF